jgi:hypothetical protein
MATDFQRQQLLVKLKEYRRKYFRKQFSDLDESATRLMVNAFLTEVLGYKELDEIKTEYNIRGEYADYVIQLNRKKHFVIEVKSIQLDLNERHLRQSLSYAANEGIDWILLFNARQIQLFRVIFGKPISVKPVFNFDLSDNKQLKLAVDNIVMLTRKCVEKKELEEYWKRFDALNSKNLAKVLYNTDVVNYLRRKLKSSTTLYFSNDDVADALYDVITQSVEMTKPRQIK